MSNPRNKKHTCVICTTPLTGKQTKFCCARCKNRDTNHRHKSYENQQERGLKRKVRLLKLKSNGCVRCGYNKNLAALCFHHRDPSNKVFQLDMRSLSNRSWNAVLIEADKCEVLCANCHAEEHNKELLHG